MLDFFWKSSIDFGINEQGGLLYLLNLISKQGKNLWVYWKKKSQKAKQACLFIRVFRVGYKQGKMLSNTLVYGNTFEPITL